MRFRVLLPAVGVLRLDKRSWEGERRSPPFVPPRPVDGEHTATRRRGGVEVQGNGRAGKAVLRLPLFHRSYTVLGLGADEEGRAMAHGWGRRVAQGGGHMASPPLLSTTRMCFFLVGVVLLLRCGTTQVPRWEGRRGWWREGQRRWRWRTTPTHPHPWRRSRRSCMRWEVERHGGVGGGEWGGGQPSGP